MAWRYRRDEHDLKQFHFINVMNNDTHEYQFDFGDNTNTTTQNHEVAHKFNFNADTKEFTVSIRQLGEICDNTQVIVVKTVGDYNSDDFNSDFNTN